MRDAPHRIAEAEGNKAENSYASCGIVRSLARGRIGRDAGPLIFKQKLRLRKNLEHGPDIRMSEHVRRNQALRLTKNKAVPTPISTPPKKRFCFLTARASRK